MRGVPRGGGAVTVAEARADPLLRCPAGHVVGERLAPGVVLVRKGRRRIVGNITVIECECEAVWRLRPDAK